MAINTDTYNPVVPAGMQHMGGSGTPDLKNILPETNFLQRGAAHVSADPFSQDSMRYLQPIASYNFKESGPWAPQQSYLLGGFGRAGQLLDRGQDPASLASQDYRTNLAYSLGPLLQYYGGAAGIGSAGTESALGVLTNPGLLSPYSNPYLAQQGQAAISPLYQNLLESLLPSIRSGAVDTGTFGGSRQGIAESLAIGRTQDAAGNTLANLYSNAYGQGLNALGQGGQLATSYMQAAPTVGQSLVNLYSQPAGLLSSVGTERDQFPWWQLAQYMDTVGGQYGTSSKEVTTDPGYKVGESLIGGMKNIMSIAGGLG